MLLYKLEPLVLGIKWRKLRINIGLTQVIIALFVISCFCVWVFTYGYFGALKISCWSLFAYHVVTGLKKYQSSLLAYIYSFFLTNAAANIYCKLSSLTVKNVFPYDRKKLTVFLMINFSFDLLLNFITINNMTNCNVKNISPHYDEVYCTSSEKASLDTAQLSDASSEIPRCLEINFTSSSRII